MEKIGFFNRYSLLIYWMVPIITGCMQACINLYFEILPWGISFIDAAIFGTLLGAFGMAIWFVVKYNSPDEKPFGQLIISHLAASIVLAIVWFYSASFIARNLLPDPVYLNYQQNQQLGRMLFGFFFYSLMATGMYLYFFYRKNKEKIIRENILRQEVKDAALRALKSQINPHFLFNSLNSIASLTITNPGKAHEMVIALSDFMRYALKKQKMEMVQLADEINHTKLYLQIEKIRFGDKMHYTIDVDKDCLDCLIPTLLLQPLFENAVKYGVYEASDPVEIKLTANRDLDHVHLILTNNYDIESVPTKGEGIGLKNVRERLRYVYNSNSLLEVKDKKGIFEVTIFLPEKK